MKLFVELATKWSELEKGEKMTENQYCVSQRVDHFHSISRNFTGRSVLEKFHSASYFLSNAPISKLELQNQTFEYLHLV